MTDQVTVEVEARNQDEAVEKAEQLAQEQGYERSSIQKIVSIKYSVLLYQPRKQEEPQAAPEGEVQA